jgi:hypothetical protein
MGFDLFGWLGGAASPGSGSGLTPDQQQMQQQQGWYPRPDMVLPTGQSLQQQAGYSNLTPAQASTVGGLGYYTDPGAQQSQSGSLLNQIAKGLGSPGAQQGIGNLQKAMAPPQPLGTAPVSPPAHIPGLLSYNPYNNIYNARARTPLDPNLALKQLRGS